MPETPVLSRQGDGSLLVNFHRYGLDFVGTIDNLRRITEVEPIALEDCPNAPNTKQYSLKGATVKLELDELLAIDDNTTSKHVELQWILRNSNNYVLMKRLKNKSDKYIYQEAILHVLAYNCLKEFNLTKVIPQVYDIVKLDNQTVFTIEAFPSAITLSRFLLKNFKNDNFIGLIEILAQIALYMIPLQMVLFFNHRDLKSDNILVEEGLATTHVLKFNNKTYTVKTDNRALLIDFGFSCIGYETGGANIIGGGSSLPPLDACPKDGRDIFHILSSLYSFELFRRHLHPSLHALFKRWLNFGNTNYAKETIKNAEDDTWIYRITSGSFFSAPNCSPLIILNDIAQQFPSIVKIE